jgi:hypothetical protein
MQTANASQKALAFKRAVGNDLVRFCSFSTSFNLVLVFQIVRLVEASP